MFDAQFIYSSLGFDGEIAPPYCLSFCKTLQITLGECQTRCDLVATKPITTFHGWTVFFETLTSPKTNLSIYLSATSKGNPGLHFFSFHEKDESEQLLLSLEKTIKYLEDFYE